MSWKEFNERPHTIVGVIDKWAKERPEKTALIMYDTEKEVTYKELSITITAFAYKLYNMGLRKGDLVAWRKKCSL